MPKTFPLSKPITVVATTDGKSAPAEVSEITLREPTADEMFDFSHPFRFIRRPEGGQETVIDGAALKKWIGRLSGQEAAIGAMAARDLQPITEWLGEELAPAKN